MTPAINQLKKAKVQFQVHAYQHDPEVKVYGEEAAEKLNFSAAQMFKTLVVQVNANVLHVALVPVHRQLDLKMFAKASQSKKAKMADKGKVERTTGYLLGGVSPIGQKKQLLTIIDQSALEFDTVFVSAGRRGLQVELSPRDLADQVGAHFFDIAKK